MPLALALPMALALALLAGCDGGSVAGGAAPSGLPGAADDRQPFAQIAPEAILYLAGQGQAGAPAWRGRLSGDELRLEMDQGAGAGASGQIVRVTRFAGRGGLSFSGDHAGQALDLAITPGACRVPGDPATYPYVVTLAAEGQLREGCGWSEG